VLLWVIDAGLGKAAPKLWELWLHVNNKSADAACSALPTFTSILLPLLDLVLSRIVQHFTMSAFLTATPDSVTNPTWLDKGDNAWQLTAASLVALQSIPGLVCIYAGMVFSCYHNLLHMLICHLGLVKTKWAINSAFMVFYAFAAVLVCWVVWAYKMAFGEHMIKGLVGKPGPQLSSQTELSAVSLPLFLAVARRPC